MSSARSVSLGVSKISPIAISMFQVDRIRAAAHQGRNLGYSATSATNAYICAAL